MLGVLIQSKFFRRAVTGPVLTAFLAVCLWPSAVGARPSSETELNLPIPGTLVSFSKDYNPVLMKGLRLDPENPLRFEFVIDPGDTDLDPDAFQLETAKNVKYFFAALTIPEEDMWVNLSPYERQRMIAQELSRTRMGRDLLAQDYLLKQVTASVLYPEKDLGRAFWQRVFHRAKAEFGTTDIPVDTFNKVWIVPRTAVVHVDLEGAYVLESGLDVMLEEDYLARQNRQDVTASRGEATDHRARDLTNTIMREIILPEVREEINFGENFNELRQIYHALILAQWFKRNLRQSVVGEVYVDRKRVNGVEAADRQAKEKIYQQYLAAFKKGVYNLIREEDDGNGHRVPRQYFSGGAQLGPELARVYTEIRDPLRLAAVASGYRDRAMVATVDLSPLTAFPVDQAMFTDMYSRWTAAPETSIAQMAEALGTTPDEPEFRGAVQEYVRQIPKTVLHEHASGLIFAENMVYYLLDDVVDDVTHYSPEEIALREDKRREARRRFVLTHDSARPYLELQRDGVDPAEIDQEAADRRFRQIFGLKKKSPLTLDGIDRADFTERLRRFVTQNPADPASDFEKSFTFIKAVTDAHPAFRYELIRQGVVQQYRRDNVTDIEITVYHDWDNLDALMEQLRQAEADIEREGGELNISILRGFRKDHYHNILKAVQESPSAARTYLSPYKGMDLEQTKAEILAKVTDMDFAYYDVPASTVQKEFEEMYEEIVRQEDRVQAFRGRKATARDYRRRLILAYYARLSAMSDSFLFQEDMNELERTHPRYAKRVGGISSIGEEIQEIDGVPIGYLNWTESPVFRKARLMGLKRSVHVGEMWSPNAYTDALRRIKQLLDLGVERLAHVTVLGLDYDRIPEGLIDERERGRAKFLQDQIFDMLERKGTHVELQPTSQMINAPIYRKYHKYKNHVAGMFLSRGINFSINPDDSSVYNTDPTREMFEIAMANPQMNAAQIHALYESARTGRFNQNPAELIENLSRERRLVLQAQEAFQLAAIVVFGSARIPDGHPQQYVADELGRLIFEMGLGVRTGGGPSVMKWPFMAFIEQREQFLERKRADFTGTQAEWDAYADDIRRSTATQSIRILLNFWEPPSPYGEERYDFYHFAFRKMGLHLKAKRVISLHGGIGTWDEILETWRRDRDLVLVGQDFWGPVLDAVKTSWEEGGFMDQVRIWPTIVDSAKEALEGVLPDAQNGGLELTTEEQTEAAVAELSEGIQKLSKLPNAVTIIGKPNTNGFSQRYLNKLRAAVREIVQRGATVRVASRGPVFDAVREEMAALGQEDRLQMVLFRHHNDINWTPQERQFLDNFPNNAVYVHEDSIHQILTTYGSRGYIILPGALGTFNKAFDILGAMQTKTIRVKPMAFLGGDFYGRIKTALRQSTEQHDPPTVSEGDWELMKVVEEEPQIMSVLGFTQPDLSDFAVLADVAAEPAADVPATEIRTAVRPVVGDQALIAATKTTRATDPVGGIDLTPMDIRVQESAEPLVIPLARVDTYLFENISGFDPVVVQIIPLKQSPSFREALRPADTPEYVLSVK